MRTSRGFFFCLLFALLCLPASAQWQRIVMSGKGGKTDVPAPHPLSYWTADPLARDDGGDFCIGCRDVNGHLETADDYTIVPHVKRLGVLAGYPIVEILYYIESHSNGMDPGIRWKFILVGTGPDQYREIYHLQAYYIVPELKPSRIVKMGDESILATHDWDGGNAAGCFQGYWWFDKHGPHPVNFDAVESIDTPYIAAGQRAPNTCWALDLDHQTFSFSGNRPASRCAACGEPVRVTVHFVLHGARAEPIKTDIQTAVEQ